MELTKDGDDSRALRRIARKLIAMADGDDLHSIREIADWIEGAQGQVLQGDEDGGAGTILCLVPEPAATTEE